MAHKMIKELLLVILHLHFAIVCSSISISISGPEECESCNMKTESAIQCINDIFKKFDPVVTESCLPCKRCKLSGLGNFALTPGSKVCTKTEGDRKENRFNITFEKVNLDCVCEFECDPVKMLQKMAEYRNNTKPKPDCIVNKDLSPITYQTKLKKVDISPEKIKKECMPLSPSSIESVWSKLKQSKTLPACPNGKSTGNLMAVWKSLKISFTTVVSQKDNKVGIGSITFESENFDDLNITCTGDHPRFNQTCKCVQSTNFQTQIIIDMFENVLPCYVNPEIDKYQNILQYLKCEQSDY